MKLYKINLKKKKESINLIKKKPTCKAASAANKAGSAAFNFCSAIALSFAIDFKIVSASSLETCTCAFTVSASFFF